MYCDDCMNFWYSPEGCQFSTDPQKDACRFFKKKLDMTELKRQSSNTEHGAANDLNYRDHIKMMLS